LQPGEKDFLVAATGVVVTFENKYPGKAYNLLSVDEIETKNGREQFLLKLNGDKDHQGRHVRITGGKWQKQKVKPCDSPAKINWVSLPYL
jgi:Domain of unknown function (DUF5597)